MNVGRKVVRIASLGTARRLHEGPAGESWFRAHVRIAGEPLMERIAARSIGRLALAATLCWLCRAGALGAAEDGSLGDAPLESGVENALWLSQLDLNKAQQECWPARADRAIAGGVLSIAGRKFEKGVGSHANSTLRVLLRGSGRRFTAAVGVDDFRPSAAGESPSQTTRGDGAKIFYINPDFPFEPTHLAHELLRNACRIWLKSTSS